MSSELATVVDGTTVERVLLHGDLKLLTSAQKVAYYAKVCDTLGFNPLTRPFDYIVLNGKEQLYAKREATEQLRKIHAVSLTIIARELVEDCYIVTARAVLPNGRTDESIGVKSVGGLKGEGRANAMMTAETKAKRRVTLSICGLGMLDETEVADIPASALAPASPTRAAIDVSPPPKHAPPRASLDAADPGYMRVPTPSKLHEMATEHATAEPSTSSDAPAQADAPPTDAVVDAEPPEGYVRVVDVQSAPTRNASVIRYTITFSNGEVVTTINAWLGQLAEQYRVDREIVKPSTRRSQYGVDVIGFQRLNEAAALPLDPMPTDADIPF